MSYPAPLVLVDPPRRFHRGGGTKAGSTAEGEQLLRDAEARFSVVFVGQPLAQWLPMYGDPILWMRMENQTGSKDRKDYLDQEEIKSSHNFGVILWMERIRSHQFETTVET